MTRDGAEHEGYWAGMARRLRLPNASARVLAFDTCSRVPACADRRPDLLGYHVLAMPGSTRPQTLRVPAQLALAQHGLLPAGGARHSPSEYFGAYTFKVGFIRYPLYLACFPAYTSARLLPGTQQDWILGSWLTFTQAGFPPAKSSRHCQAALSPIPPEGADSPFLSAG